MPINLFGQNDYKLCFSGHETFPFKYGWLKKAHNAVSKVQETDNSVFMRDEAIAIFGVGKNMVASIRFWSYHVGIIDKDGKMVKGEDADFFEKLLCVDGVDPWMEDINTIWYLHWRLVYKNELTTFAWFFNHFNRVDFDKELLVKGLKDKLTEFSYKFPAESTLKRDVDCFLKNYSHRFNSKNLQDDALESPLTELNLILVNDGGDGYRLNKGFHHSLSPHLFIYTLFEYWNEFFKSSNSLSFNSILNDVNSPGRIFCLSEDAVLANLEKCGDVSDHITWSETSGMKQVILKKTGFLGSDLYKEHMNEILSGVWK